MKKIEEIVDIIHGYLENNNLTKAERMQQVLEKLVSIEIERIKKEIF